MKLAARTSTQQTNRCHTKIMLLFDSSAQTVTCSGFKGLIKHGQWFLHC